MKLTAGDTTRTADPEKPQFPPLERVLSPEAKAERDYLFRAVIDPLLAFSLSQEETIGAERQRADGIVAKVRAHNAAVAPKKRRWWPLARDTP